MARVAEVMVRVVELVKAAMATAEGCVVSVVPVLSKLSLWNSRRNYHTGSCQADMQCKTCPYK
jgi:hypothetical protein